MSRLLIFMFGTLIFCSCSTNTEPNEDWKIYYFDFDEVDHYSYVEYEEQLFGRNDLDSNSTEYLLFEVVQGGIPKSFDDTTFIDQLENLGFSKSKVPKEKLEELNELFREKGYDPNDTWFMCMPVYRDILIFRKNDQITGIAKICFGCDILSTKGTDAKTDKFGSFKGFEKLYELLYAEGIK